MGVPKFFRYISERYPCLSELVRTSQVKIALFVCVVIKYKNNIVIIATNNKLMFAKKTNKNVASVNID